MADQTAITIAMRFLDEASGPMSRSLQTIENQARVVTGAFSALQTAMGALGVGLSATSMLNLGKTYETAMSRVKNVFQDASETVTKDLQRMSEASHHYFSFPDLAQAAVKVEDSFEVMHLGAAEMETVLARAMDISRAKGLDLEETIGKLNTAFAGSAKSGRQLGLALSDSYMQQEAFGGALKDVWGSISEGDRYWFRYEAFLQQSTKYAGMATNETNTLSGSMKALANTITDDLGRAVSGQLPLLATLLNSARGLIEMGVLVPRDLTPLSGSQGTAEVPATFGLPTSIVPATPALLPSGLPQGYQSHMTPIKSKSSGGAGRMVDPLKDYYQVMEEGHRIEVQGYNDLEKYNHELDRLSWYLGYGAISQETYTRAVENSWEALVKANEATEGWRGHLQLMKDAQAVFDLTRTEAEKYGAELEKLNYLAAYGLLPLDTYNRAVTDLSKRFEKTTDKMSEFAIQAARNIESALGDTLYNLMDGKFESIGDSFAQLLKRMAADAMAAQIGGFLFGDFGKTSKIGGVVGDAIGWIGGMMGMASGGSASAGTSYLVGERGPEIFTPASSGRITPNNQISGAGVKVENHIHNETGSQVAVEQGGVTFDGNSYHISTHLRLLKNNVGGFRDATRSLLSGGR